MKIHEKIFTPDEKGLCVIPEGVDTITEKAFAGNNRLRKVVIPESVTKIEHLAFSDCANLTDVELPSKLEGIGAYAFDSCTSLSEIYIPESVRSIGEGAFFMAGLTSITVDEENKFFASEDGVLFSKDKTILGEYPVLKSGVYEMPAGVEDICDRAFYGCVNLTGILFPKSLTDIGFESFKGCFNLRSVEIGAGVQNIWEEAFSSCYSLREIWLPQGIKSIKTLAFGDCRNLKEVHYAGTMKEWKETEIAAENKDLLRNPIQCADGIIPPSRR